MIYSLYSLIRRIAVAIATLTVVSISAYADATTDVSILFTAPSGVALIVNPVPVVIDANQPAMNQVGSVVATLSATNPDGSVHVGAVDCNTQGSMVCAGGATFLSISGMNIVLNRQLTDSDDGHYTIMVNVQ